MAIDPKLLERMRAKRKEILASGGEKKIAERHEKGLLTARERLERLFDPGSFIEFGAYVEHTCTDFGMDKKKYVTDGVITGIGTVNGRQVAAYSQDFMVGGGSLGLRHAQKIVAIQDYALENGIPVVGVNDSGGARIQEAVDALTGYGNVFYKNVEMSGVCPQISIIAGPCAGGAAYSPALTDFVIMTRKNANMFICGPQVIKAATGEAASLDQFASADAHATVSGNVHFVTETDAEALDLTKRLMSFLPSNNMAEPPHRLDQPLDLAEDPVFEEIVPETARQPLDMDKVISHVVDNGDFLEVHQGFARNLIVGFGRIQGVVVGILANRSTFKAGTLDIDSSDKGARFIRTCNAYNIPLVNLVDVPGFMPGLAQERGGIIRHGAKMLFAYASATVPKITMILRKSYGGSYMAMCSKDLGADFVFAWPSAEIAVMGAQGAVNVLFGKELKTCADPAARRAELEAEYNEKFMSPYQAARRGVVTDVIEPAQTRAVLGKALRATLNKRVLRPAKKHGNMPL